ASDLYALGATLIFALSQTEPGEMLDDGGRIQFRERLTASPDLAAVLARLTAPLPENRYASAADLERDLLRLQRGGGTAAGRRAAVAAAVLKLADRRRRAAVIATLAVALLALGGFAAWRRIDDGTLHRLAGFE